MKNNSIGEAVIWSNLTFRDLPNCVSCAQGVNELSDRETIYLLELWNISSCAICADCASVVAQTNQIWCERATARSDVREPLKLNELKAVR